MKGCCKSSPLLVSILSQDRDPASGFETAYTGARAQIVAERGEFVVLMDNVIAVETISLLSWATGAEGSVRRATLEWLETRRDMSD
jgi:hypothetical protein